MITKINGRIIRDYNSNMRRYVVAVLEKKGKDFTKCELCGNKIVGKFQLHHTTYKDAKIENLKVVCVRCNQQTENKYLE